MSEYIKKLRASITWLLGREDANLAEIAIVEATEKSQSEIVAQLEREELQKQYASLEENLKTRESEKMDSFQSYGDEKVARIVAESSRNELSQELSRVKLEQKRLNDQGKSEQMSEYIKKLRASITWLLGREDANLAEIAIVEATEKSQSEIVAQLEREELQKQYASLEENLKTRESEKMDSFQSYGDEKVARIVAESSRNELSQELSRVKLEQKRLNDQGKSEQMSEYIKKLRASITWLLGREDANLAEIAIVEATEKSQSEIVAQLESQILESMAIKEELQKQYASLEENLKTRESEKMDSFQSYGDEKVARIVAESSRNELSQELSRVKLEQKRLNDQMKMLHDTKKRLQEDNTSLQQYNCDLQADATRNAETITKLENEKNNMLETLNGLKDHANSVKLQLDLAKSSQNEVLKQKNDILKVVDNLRGELQQEREDRDHKSAEIQSLLTNLGVYKELIGKSSTELENVMTRCAALEETCSSQSKRIKTLEVQLVSANEKLKSLRNEALMQKNDLLKEVDTLRDELQQVREDRDRKSAEIQSLLSDLGTYKELTEKSSSELENVMIRCAALEETCSSQIERIKTIELQLVSAEEKLKSWQNEAFKQSNDLLKEVDTLRDELLQVREDRDIKSTKIQSLLGDLRVYRELTEKSSTELENVVTRCAALEETCSSQRKRIETLEVQLVLANEKLEYSQNEASEQNNDLLKEVDTLRVELQHVREDRDHKSAKIQSLLGDLGVYKELTQKSSTELENVKKRYDALEETCSSQSTRIKSLEVQLVSANNTLKVLIDLLR